MNPFSNILYEGQWTEGHEASQVLAPPCSLRATTLCHLTLLIFTPGFNVVGHYKNYAGVSFFN